MGLIDKLVTKFNVDDTPGKTNSIDRPVTKANEDNTPLALDFSHKLFYESEGKDIPSSKLEEYLIGKLCNLLGYLAEKKYKLQEYLIEKKYKLEEYLIYKLGGAHYITDYSKTSPYSFSVSSCSSFYYSSYNEYSGIFHTIKFYWHLIDFIWLLILIILYC